MPAPQNVPTMGRIVRYRLPDGTCRPAMITLVQNPSWCELEIFGPPLPGLERFKIAGQGDSPGQWDWPKRDDAQAGEISLTPPPQSATNIAEAPADAGAPPGPPAPATSVAAENAVA